MVHPVLQYWSVIRFGVQNTLVYRVNFLFQAAFNLIPLFTGLAIWRTIYGEGTSAIAGYTVTQMLSYYLVAAMVDALTATTEDDWQIASEIKDGRVSQLLVKPLDYLGYRLCLFVSGRAVFSLAAAIPLGLFLFLNSACLLPCPDVLHLTLFAFSVLGSALNQFLLTFLMAMLAFWVLEISTFSFILLAFQRLAAGLMFPLDILPPALHKILLFTPFAYQVYVPVEIYLGRFQRCQAMEMVAVQGLWVVTLYGLARAAWGCGLRRYAAVGG